MNRKAWIKLSEQIKPHVEALSKMATEAGLDIHTASGKFGYDVFTIEGNVHYGLDSFRGITVKVVEGNG